MEKGYLNYVIKKGDTLYSIAKMFGIDISYILFANPNINANNLQIGSNIIVPFEDVVPTNMAYTYELMQMNITTLKKVYPFLVVGNIGKSVLGKSIPYLKIGNGYKEVMYLASIHANEWITAVLLMKFIENFCRAFVQNSNIYEHNARDVFSHVSIYIVPMVNPDGVDLVTGAINKNSQEYRNFKKISNNFPEIPFPDGWKANANGVDLNLQFPAGWEEARRIKFAQGFTSPAPRDFVGYGPLTEPESLALYNFTLEHNFNLILAYHTQGEEIYWQFQDYAPKEAYYIGQEFAKVSGYTLANVPYESSFAGYKDWFLQQYRRPGYTIEAGIGESPLPLSQFNQIYNDNLGIIILGRGSLPQSNYCFRWGRGQMLPRRQPCIRRAN